MSANGISVINHKKRIELSLTIEEYVFLDFIWSTNKKQQTPIAFIQYLKFLGMLPVEVKLLFAKMKEKNLLVWDEKKKRVDIYTKWKDAFNTNNQFDELWKIHPKGNKNISRERLSKVLDKIPFDELTTRLKKYLADCKNTQRFEKDLATWLNPKNEHWNDALISKEVIKQTGTKIIFKTK